MVKEKPNSTRIYDDDGFRRRAACICVRSSTEEEVLLVTSSRRPELWIVPGGGVEPEEEPSVTAVREVLEEAGVIGVLGRTLGVFENTEHKHRTEVFVMIVNEELEEWEDSRSIGRKRQWFTIEEALSQLALHKPTQRHYIMQLQASRLGASIVAAAAASVAAAVSESAGGTNNNEENNDKNNSDGGSMYDSDVMAAVTEAKSESETTEETEDNTGEEETATAARNRTPARQAPLPTSAT